MEIKVAILPWYTKPDRGDGGIRRVVEAQVKNLREFDVIPVSDPDEADVIACHGTTVASRPGIPMVSHNHGLYWDKYKWDRWAHEVNIKVVEAMSAAHKVTTVSDWVAETIRRNMYVYPEVIYHGIDITQYSPVSNPSKYVLWNKARQDNISNPAYMNRVAQELPEQWFVSTFGTPASNVKIVGKTNYTEMKGLVANASVYLATTRETFGIGTLEALAYGVPVAGWDYGGQSEIIENGITGYLAPYGDYKALADAIRKCIAERRRLSDNCRADAVIRWQWKDKIEQYANLYKAVYEMSKPAAVKVSVILTCHNLARYLGMAIQSVLSQSFSDYEIIVVDDASTDETKSIVDLYKSKDKRVKYLPTPVNLGLPGARNYGVKHSRGQYVIFLDADDMLNERGIEILAGALDADPTLHIAYGHMEIANDKMEGIRKNNWPPAQFDWFQQMAHMNQLPYCAMLRRDVFDRSGGYRERDWRAEDASMWCRLTSYGFRAKKVTGYPVLLYRMRSDSKSKGEPGDGDWTAWYPWSIAHSVAEAKDKMPAIENKLHPDPDLVPFGAQGLPPSRSFWPVKIVDPKITIVIPVGPGHEKYLIDALDSCQSQTFRNWEVIVVNDTGKSWGTRIDIGHPLSGAPYAKLIENKRTEGVSFSRNIGAQHSTTDTLFFLDADDYLLPKALEVMYHEYCKTHDVIYTDIFIDSGERSNELPVYKSGDFKCEDILRKMPHSMQCLIPKQAHDKAGGFDVNCPGYEDWDYLIALRDKGYCSTRINIPLGVYRKNCGRVRNADGKKKREIIKYFKKKWAKYYFGGEKMPCYSCGGKKLTKDAVKEIKSVFTIEKDVEMLLSEMGEAVLLEYNGPGAKRVKVRGPVTDQIYSFKQGRPSYVKKDDAEVLLSRTRKGGTKDFLLHSKAPSEPNIPAATPATAQRIPDMPEFNLDEILDEINKAEASAPPPDPEKYKNIISLSVKELKLTIEDRTTSELNDILKEELAGKNRKSAIAVIKAELERRADVIG